MTYKLRLRATVGIGVVLAALTVGTTARAEQAASTAEQKDGMASVGSERSS